MYRVETAIATSSVSVSAGGTVTKDIASTEVIPTYIWQIGTLDGTPRGFRNAEYVPLSLRQMMTLTTSRSKIETMQ